MLLHSRHGNSSMLWRWQEISFTNWRLHRATERGAFCGATVPLRRVLFVRCRTRPATTVCSRRAVGIRLGATGGIDVHCGCR
jgi:hypothetical protein